MAKLERSARRKLLRGALKIAAGNPTLEKIVDRIASCVDVEAVTVSHAVMFSLDDGTVWWYNEHELRSGIVTGILCNDKSHWDLTTVGVLPSNKEKREALLLSMPPQLAIATMMRNR